MKTYVLRLNPDTREGLPYSNYPTLQEYKRIHECSPMNGFHEAVNFLAEDGVIRGYLPPKHLASMRTGEPFALVTITAKTARVGGDMVVGIQAGCKYWGENTRLGGARSSRALGLVWHYSCGDSLSLLLPHQIPGARKLVLGNSRNWVRGPTFEITKADFQTVVTEARKTLSTEEETAKLDRIASCTKGRPCQNGFEIASESEFDLQVANAINNDLSNIIGNKFPSQIEICSLRYQRDPSVVAYALQKANGTCGDCGNPAPFISRHTGLPYLEVHHKKMLKEGGGDTPENVIALCPNCHRKRHCG